MGLKKGPISLILGWQSRTKKSKSKSKSPNKTKNSPKPPMIFRQTTISDALLHELTHDDGLRRTLDSIVYEITENLVIDGHQIHLTPYGSYYSDVKPDLNGYYYKWFFIGEDGQKNVFFHMSLKHTGRFQNRKTFERDQIGKFHVRMDYGRSSLRRILVNDNGRIELSICRKKSYLVDELSELVVRCFYEYFMATRGACSIVESRC
jgi:hypothetical protein